MERLIALFLIHWLAAILFCTLPITAQNIRPLKGKIHGCRFENNVVLSDTRASLDDVMRNALKEGYTKSKDIFAEEQEIVFSRAHDITPLERASQLHFSLRQASPHSKLSSVCGGIPLLEATKWLQQRHLQSKGPILLPPAVCQEALSAYGPVVCRLYSATPSSACDEKVPYRTFDGTCNNLDHTMWGAANIPYVRYLCPEYGNGIDAPRGHVLGHDTLPNPRTVSVQMSTFKSLGKSQNHTQVVMQWGQFIDHDLVHTPEFGLSGATFKDIEVNKVVPIPCCEFGVPFPGTRKYSQECLPVDVTQDFFYNGYERHCMRFVRSLAADSSCRFGAREQVNQATSHLDGSAIYGSSKNSSDELRTFSRGKLKSFVDHKGDDSELLLPEMECGGSISTCFKSGDARVNEQPALTSIHTLWLRVHNKIAAQLQAVNGYWDDETVFQEARRIVSALIQHITYKEYLPIILGAKLMNDFDLWSKQEGHDSSYNREVDASTPNVFAAAAFRFGHTLVSDVLQGNRNISLVESFMNPGILRKRDYSPSYLLQGLTKLPLERYDAFLSRTLTNGLFGNVFRQVGLDLLTINIMRGRDHGIPAYNEWRKACHLPAFKDFGDFGIKYRTTFKSLYKKIDDVDLYPAALVEQPIDSSLLGSTFSCILSQHFHNIKYGDRFWYESSMQPKPFSKAQLNVIRSLTLSSLICEHTSVEMIQPFSMSQSNTDWNAQHKCAEFATFDVKPWKESEAQHLEINEMAVNIPDPVHDTHNHVPVQHTYDAVPLQNIQVPVPMQGTPDSILLPYITDPVPVPSQMEDQIHSNSYYIKPMTRPPWVLHNKIEQGLQLSKRKCTAVGVWQTLPGMNNWCVLNCNYVGASFCPESHCKCF